MAARKVKTHPAHGADKAHVLGIVIVVTTLLLVVVGSAHGQAQTKDQQKCINALNKDGAKVAATQGKENTSCIKNAGKGKESDPDGCLTRDSKGKVAKATSKVTADFDKKCTTEVPGIGVPGVFTGTAAAVADAGMNDELYLVNDVFGSPLANAIATDKQGAKCQSAVSKDYEKTFATYMKGFLKCKKNTLKAGGGDGALASCVLDDPGGKAVASVNKLIADIGKKCTENIFPGFCADDFDLANCINRRVRCRVCRTQNSMDGLHSNCDALDDGAENGSCAVGRAVACEFASTSSVELATALGPLDLSSNGSIDVATGGSIAEHEASCDIRQIDPLDIPGVGFACLNPALGCDAGLVDCDGGSPAGIALSANRNIGACTSNDDCVNKCNVFCAASGSSALPSGFSCEGFCSGDSPENQACTTDAECAAGNNGSCAGQDGVPAGNICECQCVNSTVPPLSPAGTLQCNLGVAIVVETAAPCDGTDVLITVGTSCIPMTTANALGIINNANNDGSILSLPARFGTATSCVGLDANITSGMSIGGSVAFFASTIGDILSQVNIDCQ